MIYSRTEFSNTSHHYYSAIGVLNFIIQQRFVMVNKDVVFEEVSTYIKNVINQQKSAA